MTKKSMTGKKSKPTASSAKKKPSAKASSIKKNKNSITSRKKNGRNLQNILIKSIKEGMQEKKAKDITWLNLTKIRNGSFDHFLICHADNKIQVNAIADSVEEKVEKNLGIRPHHVEGKENAEWIIVDYIDVVAHIFLGDTRLYYNLEGFWGDAVIKKIS